MLAVAACTNSEIAIFGIYYKEAIVSPLLHASTVRILFMVHNIRSFPLAIDVYSNGREI